MQAMGIPLSKKAETEFFCNLIETTLNHRQQSGTRRNDLIDLMLDAMKNPTEVSQEEDSTEQIHRDSKFEHKNKKELDTATLVATAMVMLVAGYDTTAQTLSYIAYELAMNEEVQRRLQVPWCTVCMYYAYTSVQHFLEL